MENIPKIDHRSWRWIYQQLPELTAKGILTEENAAALKSYYGDPADKRDMYRLINTALGIVTALLLGGGIIMVFAHNWSELTRGMRTAVAFIPLLASIACGFYTIRKDKGAGWNEFSALFMSLGVCAAIAIVAQVYHISGNPLRFYLAWSLLTLPLVYIFNSSAAAILFVVLGCVVNGYAPSYNTFHWEYLILPLLIVPHLALVFKADRYSLRASWLGWVTSGAFIYLTGVILQNIYRANGDWITAYGVLLSSLYLSGKQWYGDIAISCWRKPPLFVGLTGIIIVAFLSSFQTSWQWDSHFYTRTETHLCYIFVIVLAAWYMAEIIMAIKRKDYFALVPGGMAAVGILACYNHGSKNLLFPLIVFNLYLLILGITFLINGYRERALLKLNGGLLLVGTIIIIRFFDSGLGLLGRGIAFIIVGIVVLFVNVTISGKWRKQTTGVQHE